MCAITGCADGKIRVINMLSGECLRVLRGNSQCDPIITLCATENRCFIRVYLWRISSEIGKYSSSITHAFLYLQTRSKYIE